MIRRRFPPLATRREGGFTLIEVLVTVIVLAIGLLGLAGLQFSGLRYTHSAYQTSQATILAYDILDRMRANRMAAESGSYVIGIDDTPGQASCTGSVNCGPAQMVAADLYEWKRALTLALPSGAGAVARTGPVFTITVQWDDSRGEQDPKTMTLETIL